MRMDEILKEWYAGDVKKLVITVRDGKGERKIRGEEITEVRKDGFYLKEVFIPAHRIIRVEKVF